MKNIFLIGDSIRFGAPPHSPGYGKIVAEKLKGKANVYQPDDNACWAQYTLRYLGDWAAKVDCESIDVVHWNNGLWDVLRLHGDEPLTELSDYVKMLKRVYNKITKLFPNAKVIFALSTSVIEDWTSPDFQRTNKDIEEYNAAAKELMESLGAEVNDLYTISKSLGREYRCDWVHYNEEGSEIMAQKVIDSVMK